MGFLLQMFNTPSFNDTLESFTFSHTNHIDHFVLVEHRVHLNFFFEVIVGKVNLLGSRSTVNLDFEHVIFLLSVLGKTSSHLSGADSSNHSTVFSNSVHGHFNGFFLFFVFFGIFRESFLFRAHPIFVESSLGIFV